MDISMEMTTRHWLHESGVQERDLGWTILSFGNCHSTLILAREKFKLELKGKRAKETLETIEHLSGKRTENKQLK